MSTAKLGDHQVTRRIDQQGNLPQGLDQMNWTTNSGPFKGPSSYLRLCRWWLIICDIRGGYVPLKRIERSLWVLCQRAEHSGVG